MASLGLKLPRETASPRWTFESSAGEWGQRAEAAGYDSIWASEGWGANVFVDLAEIAMATETIRFGTAIANVFSRSPAVLAMGAASLARRSDGRAILGLGASHPGFVEGLHDISFERPVRRSHETIELIRALTAGDAPIEYDGQLFDVEGFPPLDADVPIYNAALGAANRRATGRLADGWIPYLLGISQLDSAYETIADAAHEAGRDPEAITVIPQILAAVDDGTETARYSVKQYIATYVGNYEAYRSIIAELFPEETTAITNTWNHGDETAAIDLVTDEMVAEFAIVGRPEIARSQLRDVLAIDAVDEVIVYPPSGLSVETLVRTVAELSPDAL